MRRHFHPIAAFFYAGALFIPAMSWSSPLWLILLLAFTAMCLLVTSDWRQWRNAFILSLSMALIVCAVNICFAPGGCGTLVTGGGVSLFSGALLSGLSAGLKIPLAVGIFILYGELADRDEVLFFLSRFAPKSSLAATLATLMIPRLRRELERIRAVMSMRGARIDDLRIIARIKASRPILHVLLLSSLDGAWDTAASLNCRAFGSGKRTSSGKRLWETSDLMLLAGALLALTLFAIGLASGKGCARFYPSLDTPAKMSDLPSILLLLSTLALAFLLAWRLKR